MDQVVAGIWQVCDLIRDSFSRWKYQDVILPLTMLYRIDNILAPTKHAVADVLAGSPGNGDDLDGALRAAAGHPFYSTSSPELRTLTAAGPNISSNLRSYAAAFSPNIRAILHEFDFDNTVSRLDGAGVLLQVLQRFDRLNLQPVDIDDKAMGAVFSGLVQKLNEDANENGGEHFTPRDIVDLTVDLMLTEDDEPPRNRGSLISIYDPCCGSGAMLKRAKEQITETSRPAEVHLFGQEINSETFATCQANLLIQWPDGADSDGIAHGNTLTNDLHAGLRFDYVIAQPPFGLDWSRYRDRIFAEHSLGSEGRFAAGLPRSSDSQLLFVQHMLAHAKETTEGGGRIALLTSASMLSSGGKAGSGDSLIRRWIIESDWLEAVIALPEHLFYNTGIATCIWILTNRKSERRRGRMLLIDASGWYDAISPLGDKRRDVSGVRQSILESYRALAEGENVAVVANASLQESGFAIPSPVELARRKTTILYAQKQNLNVVRLGDVATYIEVGRPQSEFEDRPNTIYLPVFPTSAVASSAAELGLKTQNYIQIAVDERVVLAKYLAGFFDSPLGRSIRKSVTSGVIPRLRRQSIAEMYLPLPPLAVQTDCIAADGALSNLISRFQEMQALVWNSPATIASVREQLYPLQGEERFTDWLETLPFPLASVLWAYHVSFKDDKEAYEHLLHFFEALAEFTASLLLGAASTEVAFLNAEISSMAKRLGPDAIERATFGFWVRIVERLSKTYRSMIDGNDEQRTRCLDLFRINDAEVLRRLFAPKLVTVLQTANTSRNLWTGHGGIVGSATARERHEILKSNLAEYRQVIGQGWKGLDLLKPGAARFAKGRYSYSGERLVGSRTPFEVIHMETAEPLDSDLLYVHQQGVDRALPLFPIIKIMPSPRTAQNACYFYNRREKEGLRFVSYHFGAEADVVDQFPDTASALAELSRALMPAPEME